MEIINFKLFLAIASIMLSLWLFYINFKWLKLNVYSYNYVISRKNQIIKLVLYMFSIVLLLMVFMWIELWYYGYNKSSVSSNIIFTLDVSKSMDTIDIIFENKPYSRLEYSKNIIKDYIRKNPQNSYSLIIFAWEWQIISPLTNDIDIFLTFLENINSNTISKWWSNFNKVIDIINNNIWKNEQKNAIFLSDWWDSEDKINLPLLNFNENNTKIFTIWIWSAKWDRIPIWKDFTWKRTYKKYNWEYIITKLNDSNLRELSNAWNWIYIDWLDKKNLNKLDKKMINSSENELQNIKENNNRYVILFSFVLLISWYLIPYRYLKWEK